MIPVVARQVNLKLRAALCFAIVLGSGIVGFLTELVRSGYLWSSTSVALGPAISAAYGWMFTSGVVCFVYFGLSFGRWLSLRVTPPVLPEFESTEYPRLPIEVR